MNQQGALKPLWTAEQAVVSALLVGAGAVMCVAAWVVASGRARLETQVGWLTLSVAGLGLALAGQTAWLVCARRAVGTRRRHLLGERATSGPRPVGSAPESDRLVSAEGLHRYHRADCPIAVGPGWTAAGRDGHEAAGRQPCGVCRP